MPEGPHRVLPGLAVLVLVVATLGLPINNLYAFGLLAVAVLIVFTGSVARSGARWAGAIVLTLLVVGVHVVMPAPRIEEGHNVFLIDGPGGALERGLPREAYRAMAERFDAAYPPERRCTVGDVYCWRTNGIPKQTFAFAADGIFDGHAYSRRVTGIDFHNAVWLRLGVLNDLSLDMAARTGDVERLQRDRRSLAIFGRWQVRLPYFVMFQFPAAFAGSDLCWRGEVLWERAPEQFERLEHKDWTCRPLQATDIGKRIFGVAIGPDADLAMSLDPTWRVKLRGLLAAAASAVGVAGILLLLVRWRPRRAVYPLILALATLVLVILTDATFIGGYRPFDGGDDGLIFSGFARDMLQHLAVGDIAGALKGVEAVFYFNPGMRYFRALEFLFFGDTFLLYLLLVLILPLIVHAAAARFVGNAWAFVFTLGFVLTPVGVLFGTSYLHYVSWAARGYSDTLGAMAFLSGLILLAGPRGVRFDDRTAPAFWGALLLTIAVIFRPNLVPAVGVLLGGVGLAALWQRQFIRIAALCLGFLAILLTLWHNWHFGGVIVPLSANMAAPNVLMLTPAGYLAALGELTRFDFAGANLARAVSQIVALLSGPAGLWLTIPLHVAAYLILLRVIVSGRFEPMLRLTALASLALTPVGLIYLVAVRYNLVMWLLMALVATAWIRIEGLALMDRRRPGWRERIAQSPYFVRIEDTMTRARTFAGVGAN